MATTKFSKDIIIKTVNLSGDELVTVPANDGISITVTLPAVSGYKPIMAAMCYGLFHSVHTRHPIRIPNASGQVTFFFDNSSSSAITLTSSSGYMALYVPE